MAGRADLGTRQFSIIGRGSSCRRWSARPDDRAAYLIDEALHDLCAGAAAAGDTDDGYVPTRRGERPAFIGIPRDRWFVTSTALLEAYPCRCHEPAWRPGYYCGSRCPCWGRPSLVGVPRSCCALRRLVG
jgi:hypothetical protein